MINKMIGRIKWFKKDKGYGYITGFDDETYYFEISSLIVDEDKIKENLLVNFIPKSIGTMSYADNIDIEKVNYKN